MEHSVPWWSIYGDLRGNFSSTMASYVADLITAILLYGDRYLFYAWGTVSLLHVKNQIVFI